jgi:Zn-dependent peptidase ImmA (M78 family)
MFNNHPDYKHAKKEADRILKENSIIDPPIIPIEIVENYGIDIAFVIFKDKNISGYFNFSEQKIYVNDEDPYNRQTFTIAHELGHHFLHTELFKKKPDKYKILTRAPLAATTDPIEKEANAFAAHLLVPRKMLDRYVEYGTVAALATIFAVSQEMIRNRLKSEYGYGY